MFVSQAVTDCRNLKGSQGIQVTGCQPSQTAVSQTGLRDFSEPSQSAHYEGEVTSFEVGWAGAVKAHSNSDGTTVLGFPWNTAEGSAKSRFDFGMALGEQRTPQRTGRDSVDQQRAGAPGSLYIRAGGGEVVGTVGDIAGDVAVLVGAAISLHVDAPGVVAPDCEPVHDRAEGAPFHRQVEGRLRRHGGTMHKEDGAALVVRRAEIFLPQEQANIALVRPVFLSGDCPATGVRRHGSLLGLPDE